MNNIKNNWFMHEMELKESIMDYEKLELDPHIWENGKLNPSIKTEIIKRWEDAIKEYPEIKKYIEKTFLTGSITGYFYTDTTDLDVHIYLNPKVQTDIPKEIEALNSELWKSVNGKNLPNTKHPLEFFLIFKEDADPYEAGAVYSIDDDKWIRQEDKSQPKIPIQIFDQALSFARKLALDWDELFRDCLELELLKNNLINVEMLKISDEGLEQLKKRKIMEIKVDVDTLITELKLLRAYRQTVHSPTRDPQQEKEKKALIDIKSPNANWTVANIVYKFLEKFSYIGQLKELKHLVRDVSTEDELIAQVTQFVLKDKFSKL